MSELQPGVRLGTLGHPERAVVGLGGLVTPWPEAWALDWWIGAEDRWHLPGEEVAVRHRLLGGAPVLETAMRVPGGDAVHRTFVVAAGGESWLVVEVENRTPVPVAVAFALVPPAPAVGLAGVYEIEVDERWIVANGSVAVALPKPPNRAAVVTGAQGDVSSPVIEGEAGTDLPPRAVCPDGRASAAVIYPLPHTATIRLVVPMRRFTPSSIALPGPLPDADEVVRGWGRHLDGGARFELPDPQLSEALAASRAQLLLGHGAEDFFVRPPEGATPAGGGWGAESIDLLAGADPAEVCAAVRRMLVREDSGGLVLFEGVPRGWFGAGWEVHDLPTVFGVFGCAVRWHGDRPALLWELEPHPGIGQVMLTAPGLDPDWSSTAPRGEALLASSDPR